MGMIKLPEKAINFFKENLDEIFQSGNLAEGKWNSEVSNLAKKYCKIDHAVTTNSNGSGMVALLTVYRTYFTRKNVLLQSNTMYGVKTMVFSAGCNLSGYIDCRIDTLMPDINQLKKAVGEYKGNKNELIILLSHIGGIINPDMEEISEFCKSENIILLEDCAHSYGATLKGKHSGTFGDAGVFSFYATKSIPAGEGGVVITKHSDIENYIKRFVIYDRFQQEMKVGVNIRPSEVQALLIFSVLSCTDEIIQNKRDISKKYINACEDLSIPYIIQDNANSRGNYYKFTVYTKNRDIQSLLPHLKTKTSAVYDYALGSSHEITKKHACLPIWYGQEEEITQKVIDELYASK